MLRETVIERLLKDCCRLKREDRSHYIFSSRPKQINPRMYGRVEGRQTILIYRIYPSMHSNWHSRASAAS